MLNARAIITDAEARVGIRDPETHLHANLERLVASLNEESGLPEKALSGIHQYLTTRTADRLHGLKWVRDYPEIADEVITQPIFLCGLPRSGTTFFQYLFDRDTRFRQIRAWESITPSPPPGFDAESVRKRKAEETERRRQSRPDIPGFDALHLMDEGGPDECHAFLEHSYSAAGFQNLFCVPSFFDALLTQIDLTAAYRVHRRQLQLLQWRMSQPRWALKYPNHILAMDNILEVYPDAHFVMTHRDPVQTLASIAKMTFTLRSARYEKPVDRKVVGRHMLHFVQRHIDRILAFARSPRGKLVVHVDYYRAIDNPAKVVSEVHGALGLDTPPAIRDAVAEWHRHNPKNARGKNDYSLDEYGLDADAVAEQFGEYMRHFDIPRERDGLKRVG